MCLNVTAYSGTCDASAGLDCVTSAQALRPAARAGLSEVCCAVCSLNRVPAAAPAFAFDADFQQTSIGEPQHRG